MNKIILIAVLYLISQTAVCQTNYFKIFKTPLYDWAGASIETENGDIIMSTGVASDVFLTPRYLKFYKINSSGDTIASKVIKRNEDYYNFGRILKLGNDQYIAVGSSFYFGSNNMFSIHNKLIYYTFNSNLDSISFKEVTMDDNAIQYLSLRDAILNKNNHIVTLCEDMSMHNIMLLEATLEGDSIRSSHLLPLPGYGARIYSIMQKTDYSGYSITTEGDFNHGNYGYISHIISTDSLLNFVTIDSLPGECAYISQLRPFNNNILVGGRAKRSWTANYPPYQTEEYCIEKLDTGLQTIRQVYLSHVYLNHHGSAEDTISYPPLSQNFDFTDTNNIYTCHFREYPTAIYPTQYNYFVIAKFNSNLDIKWQYYFGYDAYYSPGHIIATSDGGCFVCGMRYDYQTQYQQFDIFYLKLDSTGIYESTNEPQIPVHSAIVYPNPGCDDLNIQSGPQISGALFTLYDIQGNSLMEEKINSTEIRLNTSILPPGIYPWNIVFENKVVESGKWVKD